MLKRNWLLTAISAVALAGASSMAHSQMTMPERPFYVGANVAWMSAGQDVLDDDADVLALYGRAGAFLGPNLALEVRGGIGLQDDTVGFEGIDADLDLKNFYGVYGRAGLRLGHMVYPYVIAGWTEAEFESDYLDGIDEIEVTDSTTESDFSYGVGVDFTFSGGVTVNVEYLVLLDQDEGELDGLSIGLNMAL